MKYSYGMRLRPYGIGCQPKGVVERQDDPSGKYWDIIVYDHKLSDDEMRNYELEFLGEVTT